ncbi:MAG TPA: hypothetical protein VJP89_00430 [Pyrinomonadaceae bacterium]|nr:hypothetical protein [Pyrinomonadaceae bacterium]
MTIEKRVVVFAFTGLLTFALSVWLTPPASRIPLPQSQRSRWQVLLSFENQDLEGLSEEARREVAIAASAVTGQQEVSELHPFTPALFRSISNTAGEKHYILVEDGTPEIIPAQARIRVHLFDTKGRILSKDNFAAGWRTVLTAFRVRKLSVLDSEALIVDTDYCFGGSPAQQYYAVVGDRLMLVYLEQAGRFELNKYSYQNLTIGPQLSRSAGDWEKALSSAHEAEVLSALLWLGGDHWNGQPWPYNEDEADAKKVSLLRSRDAVRKRLLTLSESDNPWIVAAAGSALKEINSSARHSSSAP